MTTLPTVADVADAARVIAGVAVRTPLLRFDALDEATGARVFVKPETLQRTGSFKFRGAYNRLARIPDDQKQAGVVAMSSGNHAQGVALAAKLLGMPAVCVMPKDSPRSKQERTAASGAELVLYDRETEDRVAIASAIAAERGAILVPPYDDFHIIAGQGTVGREIVEDLDAMGLRADGVFICCGGGGLTAGCALAIKHASPQTKVFTVEPEGFDDHARSFAAGKQLANDRISGSLCDGLLSPMPGDLTFPINRQRIERGLVVSDEEAVKAVAFAFREMKLVVEPSGAAALAALLNKRADIEGKVVVAVMTGGNVDAGPFAQFITR
jgi:threonine dehydratase